MTSSPLVSILVPLYNQERYLGTCMRTICNQTYKNLEIIVVNDGSTDRSPQILDKFAKNNSRIKVVNKQNEGLVNARRDGYREATGDYIAFVDSDDLLPLNAIEILVRNMLQTDVDLVIGSMQRKLGFLKLKSQKGSFPLKHCFYVSMWAKLFKKSAIDRALQETELFATRIRFMGEDLHFNMKLFPYLQSMYMVDDIVYYYRIGGGSEDHFNPNYPEIFTLCGIRLELLDKYNYSKGYDLLYQEYARKVFYHAHQLIEYNKADKDGIISFFNKELNSRPIALRMIGFYADKQAPNEQISMIINRDYNAMYDSVMSWVESRHRTLRYKVKTLFLNIIEHK